MKKIRTMRYFIILCVLQCSSLQTKNMISLFIRPFPEKVTNSLSFEQILEKITLHGKSSYTILKNALRSRTFEGIFATYFGYITSSNHNGQLLFVRKHQKDEIKLLITPMIEPVMMIDLTIHHWQVAPHVPARLYSLVRKQDEETKAYYWDVHDEQIPDNKRIELDTMVIFADPDKILVPTGITLTTKSPHLILPDIYARKHLQRALEALRVLRIKQFFSPVLSETKKQNETYYSRQ